ncbi:restriction endonuclease subunit S, partial [uncultured Anaerococcus sp.]|uniref:restriction endonuclease subunit S n=1 Tax=uncultured Anaerococcus sp. TaxID=293428 RepID=UPI00262BBDC3
MTRKIPELRFAGFSGEWEEKRLGDIAEIITGTTPSTSVKDYYNGEKLFASPADMGTDRYLYKTNKTLTELGVEKSRNVRKGSTLFVCIGATIGKLIQTTCKSAFNQQINAVVPISEYEDNYIYSLLEKNARKITYIVSAQTMPIINKSEFTNSKVKVINGMQEQEKIGELFETLDACLEDQASYVETLKKSKKAFLQKLFP